MKNSQTKLALTALLACGVISCAAVKPAAAQSARGIYGLINDDGFGDVGDVTNVIVYDDTVGGSYNLTSSLAYSWYWQMIEYDRSGLPTNHQYHVIVKMIDGESGRRDFYLPKGYYDNQKIATLNFYGDF